MACSGCDFENKHRCVITVASIASFFVSFVLFFSALIHASLLIAIVEIDKYSYNDENYIVLTITFDLVTGVVSFVWFWLQIAIWCTDSLTDLFKELEKNGHDHFTKFKSGVVAVTGVDIFANCGTLFATSISPKDGLVITAKVACYATVFISLIFIAIILLVIPANPVTPV